MFLYGFECFEGLLGFIRGVGDRYVCVDNKEYDKRVHAFEKYIPEDLERCLKGVGFLNEIDYGLFRYDDEDFNSFRDGVDRSRLAFLTFQGFAYDLYYLFARCDRDLLVDSGVICLGGYSEYKKRLRQENSDFMHQLAAEMDDSGFVVGFDSVFRNIFDCISKADKVLDYSIGEKELMSKFNTIFSQDQFRANWFILCKGIELLKGLNLGDKGFVLSKDYVYGSFLVREGLLNIANIFSMFHLLLEYVEKEYLYQFSDITKERYEGFDDTLDMRVIGWVFDELFEFNDRFVDEKI